MRELAQSKYEEAILDAAEQVFARVGYAQAKMADVARATGVSVGTLYNYFESKQAVFLAIARRNIRQLMAALDSVGTDGDPLDRLAALLRRTLQHAEEHNVLFALFMQLGGLGEFDIGRILGKEGEAAYDQALSYARSALTDAARDGQVRADIDTAWLATYMAGMVNAAIFAWTRQGRDTSLVDRTDEIMGLFLQGARAR